jgi:hypothetical protein
VIFDTSMDTCATAAETTSNPNIDPSRRDFGFNIVLSKLICLRDETEALLLGARRGLTAARKVDWLRDEAELLLEYRGRGEGEPEGKRWTNVHFALGTIGLHECPLQGGVSTGRRNTGANLQ